MRKRAPSPIVPRMRTISAMGCPAGISQLLHSPRWKGTAQSPGNPVAPVQPGPVEMHYEQTGTDTVERGGKIALVWHIPTHIYCLTSVSTISPGQHVWFAQPVQAPKTEATLTYKNQAISVILIGDLSNQVPTKLSIYLSNP